MTALWMAWAVVVTALLGSAAAVGEWLLRAAGRPGRWSWTTALGASVALPAWALLRPPSPAPDPAGWTMPAPALVESLGELTALGEPGVLAAADPWLRGGWLLSSLLVLTWLAVGLVRLSLKARQWPRTRLGGGEVLVSDGFGPALLGLGRARVVLPRWSLALDGDSLGLVLLHEREHARAGDGFLLLAGALAMALAPWNPALWWQLRRLRSALEVDCDRRVLSHGVSRVRYGRLLVKLGRRGGGGTLAVAGLARPRSTLERRLTMMVRGVNRGSPWRIAGAAALATVLVVAACETPTPTGAEAPAAVAAEQMVMPVRVDLGGPDAPLVFVDGEPTEGVPDDLSPEAIARVEVLKGSAALELYGEEGRNGAIHIFTKVGEERRAAMDPAPGAPGALVEEVPDGQAARTVHALAAEGVEVYVDGERFREDVSTLDPATILQVDVRKGRDGFPDRVEITLRK